MQVVRKPAGATPRGGDDRRKRVARRLFVTFWLFALAVHLAWVPHIVWFMAHQTPPASERRVVEISPVSPSATPAPPSQGQSEVGSRNAPDELELPGMSPGGSVDALAPRRHEWEREATLQQQPHAPRALDHAAEPRAYRPHRRGRQRSPADRVSLPDPASADIMLVGVPSRDDSLLRHRGESRRGELDAEPGAGGTPSVGNRVRLGDGALAMASAGQGSRHSPRVVRRGARPRLARPAVVDARASADEFRPGRLAGMQPSRQAAPELAFSAPVREPRRASGDAADPDVLAAGHTRRRTDTGGSSNEAVGPGLGGRGRGVSGSGSASSSLLNDYMREAQAQIGRHWSYPEELALDMQQGLVVLVVRVRHDGRVSGITVRRSSGFEHFDARAIRAVQAADPLPPPPPEELFRHGGRHLELPLSMRYRNPMFD